MSKDLANKKETLPATIDFQADAGAGWEEVDKDAFAIPFIVILQALSPQVDEGDGAYVENAKPGMFLNTVTGDLFNELEVIPVHYSRSFIEWVVRENGGGFVANHDPSEGLQGTATRDEKNRDILPNGNQLVDTRNHFVLAKTSNGYQPAIVAFSSTAVKKSRKWMTNMDQIKLVDATGRSYTPPMFANRYMMTTVKEKNDKGSWHNFKLERIGLVEDPNAYQMAKDFRDQINSGEAKAAHESVVNDADM